MALDRDAFGRLQALVKAASGVALEPEKAAAVESRLGAVARREDFCSVADLVSALRPGVSPRLVDAVVDALVTADTRFFRDRAPFEQFRSDVLPFLAKRAENGTVRVLSAGCGSGQEVWSLAMAAEDAREGLGGGAVEIVGTDLSERSLEKARSGLYTQFEVQRGLPIRLLLRWFDKVDEAWRVSPRLRQSVAWSRYNLMDDPAPLGRFHVVFCRNVISAFDAPTRAAVLERLAGALVDEGFLFLGPNESAEGVAGLTAVTGRPGLHLKPGRARRVA
jgi:chemotaxis protein methyltransferase CheR